MGSGGVVAMSHRKALEPWVWDRGPRLALGLLLLVSAYSHLKNSYFFLGSIYDYRLVSETVGIALAGYLPILQVVIGVCVLVGVLVPAAAVLAGLLFALFVTAQSLALLAHREISCGCFGVDSSGLLGPQSLLLALTGFILALLALLRAHSEKT